MTGYLILIAFCAVAAQAIPRPAVPLRGRIGGSVPAELAPHACMVLVHRRNLDGTNTAALGGGSIISARHTLTAAHLVQGDNINYQIGFLVGSSRRMVNSTFRLIHEDYNNADFIHDIALLFLQGSASFPLANAISISIDAAIPAVGTELTTVGFGFTAADSTGASSDPYASAQQVADPCVFERFNLTETHFCAQDGAATTWICPGDNGAGAFAAGTTAAENELVGIVSRVLTGCAEAQPTGYTVVGVHADWISNVTGISVSTFISNYNKLNKS